MDRRAWQAAVHSITKESDMTERLSAKCTQREISRLSRSPYVYIHQSCSEVPGHNKQHSEYCFHPLEFRQTTYPGAELLFAVQWPALSKIYFSFFSSV